MAALRIMNSLSHMRSELLNPVRQKHTQELKSQQRYQTRFFKYLVNIFGKMKAHSTLISNKRKEAFCKISKIQTCSSQLIEPLTWITIQF